MQTELRALHIGLKYKELEIKDGKYLGYVNKEGDFEGVGIRIWTDNSEEEVKKKKLDFL
jgi:hypothetical protein